MMRVKFLSMPPLIERHCVARMVRGSVLFDAIAAISRLTLGKYDNYGPRSKIASVPLARLYRVAGLWGYG